MDPDRKRFVIWDGRVERPYIETDMHDCVVCDDGKLLSIQKRRREVIEMGHVPILLFACESGLPCEEDVIDGEGHGVFSYFLRKHFRWTITLRKLIKKVNDDAWKVGYFQKAEVVCPACVLDMPLNRIGKRLDCAVCLFILDMCRTPGDFASSNIL